MALPVKVAAPAIEVLLTRIATALEAIAAGSADPDPDVDAIAAQLTTATTDLATSTDTLAGAVDSNS